MGEAVDEEVEWSVGVTREVVGVPLPCTSGLGGPLTDYRHTPCIAAAAQVLFLPVSELSSARLSSALFHCIAVHLQQQREGGEGSETETMGPLYYQRSVSRLSCPPPLLYSTLHCIGQLHSHPSFHIFPPAHLWLSHSAQLTPVAPLPRLRSTQLCVWS